MVIASAESVCGRLGEVSSPTWPQGEGGAKPDTAAANEVTGLPQGVSLLWARPRPQKGGKRGPAVVIQRDGCGRVAADEVAGGREGGALTAVANEATRRPRKSFGLVDVAAQEGCEVVFADVAVPGRH